MLRGSSAAKLMVLLFLILLSGLGGSNIAALGASAPASMMPLIWVTPTLSIVPIGEETCVDIRVQDVENLFGFETVIRFDPARVSVLDADTSKSGIQIQPGPFLQPEDPYQWFVINNANNGNGSARLAITRMAPLGGVSGSGVLATACFRGNIRGHSLVNLSLSSTLMLDTAIAAIPYTLKSGGILVGPVYRLRIPATVRGF